MRHTQDITEYELPDGSTVIIEWSTRWNKWIGTVNKHGWHDGSILRDSIEEILETARERRG